MTELSAVTSLSSAAYLVIMLPVGWAAGKLPSSSRGLKAATGGGFLLLAAAFALLGPIAALRPLNCTASVVGCLLAHQGELHSVSCGAAVADVAECCPRGVETRCAEQEDEVALLCQADVRVLQQLLPHECWATHCEADMVSCLIGHQGLLREPKCAQAVRTLSSCSKGAWDLLGPMVIAAYLLLATASVVLLCTMLRCCCRCLCTATGLASLQEDLTQSDEDEAGTEDDELGSVTPLPLGVKQQKTLTQEEEEENALPGYSEVVEGATIPLQPTSSMS